jgi:uncharacterized protein (TIGR00255 family)
MVESAGKGGRRGKAKLMAASICFKGDTRMIYSMTGYGKGEAREGEGAVTAEVRTVNHRFIDFSIRVPRVLSGYEKEIEKVVRGSMKRGHVYVTVVFDRAVESESFAINKEVLRRSYRMLTDFAIEEGIPGRVDIGALLSLPDAFTNGSAETLPEGLWISVRRALGTALERCVAMRASEGAELARDILRRLGVIEKAVARIEKKAPVALKRALARAKGRLRQLIEGNKIDEARWITEAALMAERTDFSEEVVRIKSHLVQFRSVLHRGEEVSKSLTFLLQEIHREATTMANKATDASIIRECLTIKEGVEKIREQIQNLE